MKPIIGISCNEFSEDNIYSLKKYYVNSILESEGVPVILPPISDYSIIKEYTELCAGILLTGGGDIDPYYFGEPAEKDLGEINPLRDFFEIKLADWAIQRKIPLLGICRGCQVLNIAAGGSVIQHIKSNYCHNQKAPRNYPIHDIFITKNSKIADILNSDTIRVNSFHHQAVNKLGKDLAATARSADGIIEAIENKVHPFCIGVQWHPECMQDTYSRALFKAFVKKAQLFKGNI